MDKLIFHRRYYVRKKRDWSILKYDVIVVDFSICQSWIIIVKSSNNKQSERIFLQYGVLWNTMFDYLESNIMGSILCLSPLHRNVLLLFTEEYRIQISFHSKFLFKGIHPLTLCTILNTLNLKISDITSNIFKQKLLPS